MAGSSFSAVKLHCGNNRILASRVFKEGEEFSEAIYTGSTGWLTSRYAQCGSE